MSKILSLNILDIFVPFYDTCNFPLNLLPFKIVENRRTCNEIISCKITGQKSQPSPINLPDTVGYLRAETYS